MLNVWTEGSSDVRLALHSLLLNGALEINISGAARGDTERQGAELSMGLVSSQLHLRHNVLYFCIRKLSSSLVLGCEFGSSDWLE